MGSRCNDLREVYTRKIIASIGLMAKILTTRDLARPLRELYLNLPVILFYGIGQGKYANFVTYKTKGLRGFWA